MKIFRIDFSTKRGEYVGTQFIEAPSKSFAFALVKSGYIFNNSERKLKRIKEIKSIKTAQENMKKGIIVRKFNLD